MAENGAANDETLNLTNEILKILKKKINISTNFLVTDGDHKFDYIHEHFSQWF